MRKTRENGKMPSAKNQAVTLDMWEYSTNTETLPDHKYLWKPQIQMLHHHEIFTYKNTRYIDYTQQLQ